MVLKDEQLTAIQHVHNGNNVLVWLHAAVHAAVKFCMGSYHLYRASRPLRKGRSGISPSTDFETMASHDTHDAGVVYFTEYLSVLFQLTYIDELYRECNGTAHVCVNSGYQVLFSPITECLGTRLGPWRNVTYRCMSMCLASLVPRPSASRARIAYVTFEPLSDKLAEGLVPLLRHLQALKHCNMVHGYDVGGHGFM